MSNEKVFEGGLSTAEAYWIGIDQSYTGFGLTAMNKDGKYRTWVYKSQDTGIDRILDIQKWLEHRLLDLGARQAQDVVMEAPVRMSHSALMSGELFCAVRLTLRSVFGPSNPGYPIQCPPATLKKYVTGQGTKVGKNMMLLHTYKKWGVTFNDDNAADSYGLARISTKTADTAYEKAVLKTLSDSKFRDKTPTG